MAVGGFQSSVYEARYYVIGIRCWCLWCHYTQNHILLLWPYSAYILYSYILLLILFSSHFMIHSSIVHDVDVVCVCVCVYAIRVGVHTLDRAKQSHRENGLRFGISLIKTCFRWIANPFQWNVFTIFQVHANLFNVVSSLFSYCLAHAYAENTMVYDVKLFTKLVS